MENKQDTINKIIELRKNNIGLKTIAKELNVSLNLVRYWSNKSNLEGVRHKVSETRICEQCNILFNPKTENQKYCSQECSTIFNYDKRKNTLNTYNKICLCCNKDFITTNKNKKYCSERCCNKHHKSKINKNREKICKQCNKPFMDISKFNKEKYCSELCKKKWINENPKHEKICLQCNEKFKTNIKKAKYCSTTCQLKMLKELNAGRKGNNAKMTEERKIIETLKIKHPNYIFRGGFTGIDGYLTLECKNCGYIFERSGQILKPSSIQNIVCKECLNIKKEKKIKEKAYTLKIKKEKLERMKKEKEIKKEIERLEKIKTIICEECGNEFETNRPITTKYCCDICRKRAANRKKDERIYKNGDADTSITLTKLISRDNNTCYICGNECNDTDFKLNKDGYFIVGNTYPSIEHVIPLSKGGLHSWDNVKLACFRCNTLKSDNIYYEKKNSL